MWSVWGPTPGSGREDEPPDLASWEHVVESTAPDIRGYIFHQHSNPSLPLIYIDLFEEFSLLLKIIFLLRRQQSEWFHGSSSKCYVKNDLPFMSRWKREFQRKNITTFSRLSYVALFLLHNQEIIIICQVSLLRHTSRYYITIIPNFRLEPLALFKNS